MKMQEAQDIISGKADRSGFVVTFEIRGGGMLTSDHFPDVREGEPGIPTETEAWALARDFAARRTTARDIVNVYVVFARDFTPVGGYREQMFNVYPPVK